MQKILQLFVLLAIVVGLAAPGLVAEEKKYRFEVFGGMSSPIEKNFQIGYPQAIQPIKGTQEFSEGGRGGVRFGIDGARHWGQDYTYSYGSNATRVVTDLGRFAFRTYFHEATTNILFYPGNIEKTKVHFFVTGGLGAMWVVVNRQTLQDALNPAQAGMGQIKNEAKFTFNAGAGVRFRVSERYGFRIDVRDYMTPPLRYGLPVSSEDINAAVFPIEHPFHQLFGSLSFVVHF